MPPTAAHLADPVPVPPPVDMPLPAGGSHRNAIPLYEFPNQRIARHLVMQRTLRAEPDARQLKALTAFFEATRICDTRVPGQRCKPK